MKKSTAPSLCPSWTAKERPGDRMLRFPGLSRLPRGGMETRRPCALPRLFPAPMLFRKGSLFRQHKGSLPALLSRPKAPCPEKLLTPFRKEQVPAILSRLSSGPLPHAFFPFFPVFPSRYFQKHIRFSPRSMTVWASRHFPSHVRETLHFLDALLAGLAFSIIPSMENKL